MTATLSLTTVSLLSDLNQVNAQLVHRESDQQHVRRVSELYADLQALDPPWLAKVASSLLRVGIAKVF